LLLPRIIPCLLLKNNGLVKTINFKNSKYIGDPINAVRIFNEKEVDELIVLDIDASVNNQEPNIDMISNLASECCMPLCYGGGIKTIDQIKMIIELGVEKISLSSIVIENPGLIKKASKIVGNQSIVVTIDVRKKGDNFIAFTHNGNIDTGFNAIDLIEKFQEDGVGEIVINSIDDDGEMTGYNFDLINRIIKVISVPLTVIGGAGSIEDIKSLINSFGLIGASAGSLFIFKGVYKAVLINYPNKEEKEAIFLPM